MQRGSRSFERCRLPAWALPVWLLLCAIPLLTACLPQAAAQQSQARGLYNWVHTTGDAERAFEFYHEVLGLTLAPSPFGTGPTAARPERIRPAAEAGSDPLVSNLTNTPGARFRTAFMHAPDTPFGLELSEFFDIPRNERPANAWDPGASRLMFAVRDLDAVMTKVRARGAPLVTLGGEAIAASSGRAVLVRDPDGYLIELRQASREEIAAARQDGAIVRTTLGITVANMASASAFYRDLLGLTLRNTREGTAADLRLNGLSGGRLTQTIWHIRGTAVEVTLSSFTLPAGAAPAQPYHWRIQDVGAPQFQLEVRDLDSLLAATVSAGYGFLSVGGKPIERPFGRFVFAIDPDGVLVEFVEPAAASR